MSGDRNILGPKCVGPKRPGPKISGPKRLGALTSMGQKWPGARTSRGRDVPKRPKLRLQFNKGKNSQHEITSPIISTDVKLDDKPSQ